MKKTTPDNTHIERENAQNAMSYDEAILRVETIVKQLEQADALSLDEYKRLATEAKDLLDFCRLQLQKDQTLFNNE